MAMIDCGGRIHHLTQGGSFNVDAADGRIVEVRCESITSSSVVLKVDGEKTITLQTL